MIEGLGRTFAVADLHGRLDLLEAALTAIGERATSGRVVFLGDYVDRGPHGAPVLDRLVAGPPTGWRWICLKGNHEAMMALALRHPEHLHGWIDNGGQATIDSYRDAEARIAGHLDWIEALPTMHVEAHRIFVHAGVEPELPLAKQRDETLLWKRYRGADARGHGARHVVHGHDPDKAGPRLYAGRTALDTLAWRSGRLVVGVFDDERAGGPVDLIEIRCRPD